MLKISSVISARLEQKNLKQKEVAQQINVNPRTFSTYVQGDYFPPLDVLSDICQCLDIDLNHLLNLESEGNLDLLIQGKNEAKVCNILRNIDQDELEFFMNGIQFLEESIKKQREKKKETI